MQDTYFFKSNLWAVFLKTGWVFVLFSVACIEDPTLESENKQASQSLSEPPASSEEAPTSLKDLKPQDTSRGQEREENPGGEQSFLRPLNLKNSLLSPAQKQKHQRLAQKPLPLKEGVIFTCSTLDEKTVVLKAHQYKKQAAAFNASQQSEEVLLCDLFIGSVLFSFANHEAEHCFYRLDMYIASLSQRGYKCRPSVVEREEEHLPSSSSQAV